MKLDDKKIKEILLKGSYVLKDDIKKAEKYAKKTKGTITDYLFIKQLITRDLLGQAIAEDFKVSYADLNSAFLSKEQILKIPKEIAKKFKVVLFKFNKQEVIITTDNPNRENLKEEIIKIFPNRTIKISYSLPGDIQEIFIHYRKVLEARFVKIIKEQKQIAPEIIGEILDDAITFRASDVHFEPAEKEVRVRFRIDGVLNEVGNIPKNYYENVVNRIKVQANLRIDKHFVAQDGAIRYGRKGSKIDLRVSIVPTINGEKIVIRILSEYIKDFTLNDLGFSSNDQESVEKASKKPFGMILVTGPTGSGKTTSLYSVLKLLNSTQVNITTIEDPVEYKIVGINQIQVNKETNLTFAQGLRSIVRQDPDIILVGEIRDRETAEIAVNAALTGHLLFSTFHSNDAATTIPRLLDMDIEPFLLASTLEMIIAQRLVRQICDHCRVSVVFDKVKISRILPNYNKYLSESVNLYKGKGCGMCDHTGYKGRMAIFEIIRISRDLQELILKNPSARDVWDLAKKQGTKSLFEDGLEKVKNGMTTLEELIRVASPPLE